MFQGVFLLPWIIGMQFFERYAFWGSFTSEDKDRSSATGRGIKNGERLRLGEAGFHLKGRTTFTRFFNTCPIPDPGEFSELEPPRIGSLRHSL